MNPDPLATNNRPMKYTDALLVALIVMAMLTFTVFMPTHNYDVFVSDPSRFVWDLIVFVFATYLTIFGSLTGLTVYAKRGEGG